MDGFQRVFGLASYHGDDAGVLRVGRFRQMWSVSDHAIYDQAGQKRLPRRPFGMLFLKNNIHTKSNGLLL